MPEVKENLMDKIISLCKRRGFVFPSSEIYGGLANAWDFGPYGVQLKKNIKDHWWKFFVESRDDMVGLDAAIIMNPKVWEASGHLSSFSDFLAECKNCHERIRADQKLSDEDNRKFSEKTHLVNQRTSSGEKSALESQRDVDEIRKEMQIQLNSYVVCPNEKCKKKDWTVPEMFNLMLQTALGPIRSRESIAYLRPETAQAMFVDFNLIQNTSRKKLPFGVAQIGKAFRNEITPGNFIFRTREFELMEFEYFFDPKKTKWEEAFEMWKEEMEKWMKAVGIDASKTHAVDIPDGERAHYSKRTIDFEFEYPFGQKELFGLAYRGDYDLEQHEKASGQELRYLDPETNEKIRPHVIEPAFGADRAMLAILLSSYAEEELKPARNASPARNAVSTMGWQSDAGGEGDIRTVLKLPKRLAPVKVAVFPLMKNKPELVAKAKEIFDTLKTSFNCEFDDNGNVGKRYRRQDEIGTPYCVTIDFDTLTDGAVTIRDRDTMVQERVKIEDLKDLIQKRLNNSYL